MKISHDTRRQTSVGKSIRRWLAQRSLLGYARNRFQWYTSPRFFIHPAYPLHLDIECSSHCTMHCPMCFRVHRRIENEGNMSLELFRKIIDEVAGKVYSLKFTGRGETLCHREFPRFLEYVKGKRFGEVGLITNGQLLTEEIMHSFIDNELDFVSFSIDGLKADYERIRAPMTYELILATVRRLHELRRARRAKKPLIRISAVDKFVGDSDDFLRTWSPYADDILYLCFKDYAADSHGVQEKGSACPFLYQRMIVHWNGTVPMCINDEYEEAVRGSLAVSTVREIWNGEAYRQARVDHEKGRREVYPCCGRCRLYVEEHGRTTMAARIFHFMHRALARMRA